MKKKTSDKSAKKQKFVKVPKEDYIPNLCYQSLFDEALNMAYTLQDIDAELRMAAQCEGDYPGGYPAENLLPQLCKIMYADPGYWKAAKYDRRKKTSSK